MQESQKFLVVAAGSLIFVYALLYIIGVVFQRQTMQLIQRVRGFKVLTVNTASLDWITDEDLIENLFALPGQSFESAAQDKKLPDEVSLTLYSLFKQIKQGDADEYAKNKQNTPVVKYNVWLQQAGKTKLQCQKEYVILLGQHDPYFNETVKAVAKGELTKISDPKEKKGLNKPTS